MRAPVFAATGRTEESIVSSSSHGSAWETPNFEPWGITHQVDQARGSKKQLFFVGAQLVQHPQPFPDVPANR